MQSLSSLRKKIFSFPHQTTCLVSLAISILALMPVYSPAAIMSEEALKDYAKRESEHMKDVDIGAGIVGRRVTAVGRTLMFQYDVVEDWQLFPGAKNSIISNIKEAALGDFYFKQSINLMYVYFKKNSAPITIFIKPQEFSPKTLELGEYISINGHPKSKGINLRIRPPKGWSVEEASGPNIVKKFSQQGKLFQILTKDMPTFMSRAAYRERYSDEAKIQDFAEGVKCDGGEVLDYSLVTVGLYPAIQIELKCRAETMGKQYEFFQISWSILYEDKMVMLLGQARDEIEYQEWKRIYSVIAVTTSFPEQYN
jgi:hypothetical protein